MKSFLFLLFLLPLMNPIHASSFNGPSAAILQDEAGRQKIRPDDLPQNVKEALNTSDYHHWVIKKCWKVTAKDKPVYYEIHLKYKNKHKPDWKIVYMDENGKTVQP